MRKTAGFSVLVIGSALFSVLPCVSCSQARGPAVAAGFAVKDVGEYELTPGIVLTVTRQKNKLMIQANTEPKPEVFPESEMKFLLQTFEWQIGFAIS